MGYLSVYRIFLGFAMFHVILMFFTLGVRSQKDCRAGLHNGYVMYIHREAEKLWIKETKTISPQMYYSIQSYVRLKHLFGYFYVIVVCFRQPQSRRMGSQSCYNICLAPFSLLFGSQYLICFETCGFRLAFFKFITLEANN